MTYTPRAVYTDGSYLDLKDGARYEDIDRSRLASFCLLHDDKVTFHMVLKPGERLIWRKRIIKTPGVEHDQVWHLIGWQKTVGRQPDGENIQCISYISEDDGTVVMAGQWEGEHILMGNVQLLDFE